MTATRRCEVLDLSDRTWKPAEVAPAVISGFQDIARKGRWPLNPTGHPWVLLVPFQPTQPQPN